MKDRPAKHQLIAVARQTRDAIESRLVHLREQHGQPIPLHFQSDPVFARLGRQLLEIEYELYGIAPELTAEQLYPEELFLEDFFAHGRNMA